MACLLSGGGASVALNRKGVLILARNLVRPCRVLACVTHAPAFEGAGQAVRHHAVFHRHMAELGRAGARAANVVGDIGHALDAAGEDGPRLAEADVVVGVHGGSQAGAADLVHGDGGNGVRQAGIQGDLTGGILPGPGLKHLSDQRPINRVGGTFNAIKGLAGDLCPDGRGGQRAERTKKSTHGAALGSDDHTVRHGQRLQNLVCYCHGVHVRGSLVSSIIEAGRGLWRVGTPNHGSMATVQCEIVEGREAKIG